jgi:small conductance mechanosensitive channel
MTSAMERSRLEPTLTKFFGNLVSIGLKVLLVVGVASMVGIATTSFIVILGAAGLAVVLALQGSLANFAGGVLILIFRPFRVGDFIEGQGVAGTVLEIQIFNTVLRTPDNKRIVVPNGALSNGIITRIVGADERVLEEPAPVVVVGKLGERSVDLTIPVWANARDCWPL